MANELVISGLVITYRKNGARITLPIDQLTIDVAGTVVGQGVITVATSAAALSLLPAAPGLCVFKNLDATNYIQVGPDATNWFVKLTAERPWAILPLNGTAIQAKANTAACDLQYIVFAV